MTNAERTSTGVEQDPGGQVMALNPVEVRRETLIRGLTITATGQGAWEHWPESAPVGPVPSLLRIGRTLIENGDESGYPVVIPLLGENSMVIGDPQLAVPIEPQSPPGPTRQTKAEREHAQKRAAAMNRNRKQQLLAQRSTAIGITRGIIARAGGMLPEGDLHVTVYDSFGNGRQFAPLGAMNRGVESDDPKPPRYTFSEDLPTLLRALRVDVHDRFELLGDTSLRHHAEQTGKVPVPWRIVALMGAGEQLSAQDQNRLDNLIEQGAAAGMSFILSGFGSKTPTVHVDLLDGRWAQVSTLPGMNIYLDSPPNGEALARSVTHNLPVQITGPRTRGPQYRREILARSRRYEYAKAVEVAHEDTFPLLSVDFLTRHLPRSIEEQDYMLEMVAYGDDPYRLALQMARHDLLENSMASATERWTTWAVLELARSAEESQRKLLRELPLTRAAGKYIQPYIGQLAQLVAATAPKGLEFLGVHPEMHPFIAQYLPEQPPAWAYQLVADIATTPRLSFMPGRSTSLEAICHDLIQRYYPEADGRPDLLHKDSQALREALVELRLLELYEFSDEQDVKMQDLLGRRAAKRLAVITRDMLPETAHTVFDVYEEYRESRTRALPSGAKLEITEK